MVEGIKEHSALPAIFDKKTKLPVLEKLESHHVGHLNEIIYIKLTRRKTEVGTMTNDNGIKFGQQVDPESRLGAPVFFCHPSSF